MTGNNKITALHFCDKFGVSGSSIHGVSRLLSWLFPRFDRERFSVRLYGMGKAETAGKMLRQKGIDITYLDKNKADPTVILSILKTIRKERADIVVLHGYAACTFGRIAAAIAGVPAVIHEYFVDEHMPIYESWADALLSGCTAKAVACSRFVRDFLIEKRSVSPDKVVVFPYGIPLEDYTLPPEREIAEERRRLGIPADHRVVGTIGRLHPVKGHTYFLKAARTILQTYPETTFLVVGDGALRDQLERETKELGIDRRVVFTGYCRDITLALGLIDISVIASLSEGAPLTYFEALAAGKPVVATKVGGIPELVRDGETGILVAPRDPDAIASGVAQLLGNPSLAQRLGCNAALEATNNDIFVLVRKLEDLYSEVVAQARKRRANSTRTGAKTPESPDAPVEKRMTPIAQTQAPLPSTSTSGNGHQGQRRNPARENGHKSRKDAPNGRPWRPRTKQHPSQTAAKTGAARKTGPLKPDAAKETASLDPRTSPDGLE